MSVRQSSAASCCLLLKIAAAGALIVAGTAAVAGPRVSAESVAGAKALKSDFDLGDVANPRAINPGPNHRFDRPNGVTDIALRSQLSLASKDRMPEPRWELQFDQNGPMIEIAGLGAGRKGAPSLLHLSLGWDF